jgi:hypothetical protein
MATPNPSVEEKPFRIAVLLGDLSNPFWEEMERAYRAALKGRAMTVEPIHRTHVGGSSGFLSRRALHRPRLP